MTEVIWTSGAADDLIYIYAQIYFRNPVAAERTVIAIEKKAQLLGRHPKIGVNRPDLDPNLRMLSIPPHLLFYVITDNAANDAEEIKIIRVLDGRRDLRELL